MHKMYIIRLVSQHLFALFKMQHERFFQNERFSRVFLKQNEKAILFHSKEKKM